MGDVSLLQLLSSELISDATRTVMTDRLNIPAKTSPEFFSEEEFRVLVAVSDRLLPQSDSHERIDVAGMFDTALLKGEGNGWRYDKLPADGECFKSGMHAIQAESMQSFRTTFDSLTENEQDAILLKIQQGNVSWSSPDPAFFFEELLVTLTELYYSHPYGRVQMNDFSAADAAGWKI